MNTLTDGLKRRSHGRVFQNQGVVAQNDRSPQDFLFTRGTGSSISVPDRRPPLEWSSLNMQDEGKLAGRRSIRRAAAEVISVQLFLLSQYVPLNLASPP